jgi:two-component system NtrC family sensor kinase
VAPDRRDLEASIEAVPDGRVLVKVRDTGVGIREEVLSRIFDPFFTTRKQGEGTGLGLSICHGIIQQLGGEIRIESKENEGTSAFVYLPIDAPPARQSPTLAA